MINRKLNVWWLSLSQALVQFQTNKMLAISMLWLQVWYLNVQRCHPDSFISELLIDIQVQKVPHLKGVFSSWNYFCLKSIPCQHQKCDSWQKFITQILINLDEFVLIFWKVKFYFCLSHNICNWFKFKHIFLPGASKCLVYWHSIFYGHIRSQWFLLHQN